MRFARRRIGRFALVASAAALLGMATAFGGCGSESESKAPDVHVGNLGEPTSEYVEVLFEFRAAALAGQTFDAYGYAEYLPLSQRAAIDGFCLLVDKAPQGLPAPRPVDSSHFTERIEAAARAAGEYGSIASLRKAIDKLKSILGTEALETDLAGRYANACY